MIFMALGRGNDFINLAQYAQTVNKETEGWKLFWRDRLYEVKTQATSEATFATYRYKIGI